MCSERLLCAICSDKGSTIAERTLLLLPLAVINMWGTLLTCAFLCGRAFHLRPVETFLFAQETASGAHHVPEGGDVEFAGGIELLLQCPASPSHFLPQQPLIRI